MAEPPITTTVPESVTIETGADKEQLGNLEADFKDFWVEQDSKGDSEKAPSEAPAAPSDTGPAQETKEEPKETKPVPSEPKPAAVSAESPVEIDKLELPPNARPEHVEQFKKIKDLWKADQRKAEEHAKRVQSLESELAQARQNAWTPEVRADYEHAAAVRRRFDFVSDPDFIQRFHVPVRTQYEQILEEAFAALPDRDAARAWADYMKANYQPDQLNKDWWTKSVIDKIPNELDRTSVRDSVSQLLRLQRERDGEIQRRTQDKSAFDNWIQEKTQFTAKRVHEEIMAEIGEQEKRIADYLPRDPEMAKTNEEKEAITAHNERFKELNTHFVNTMHDLSKNGPRAWVRAAVEATRTQIMDQQIRNLESELKDVKAQRDQYKGELDKITGARRKITHTSGTAPVPKKDGLSIKSLDVRDAFRNYEWGDNT